MAGKNNLESVDINKDASGQGLFEDLEKLAKSRATKVSKIAAKVYICREQSTSVPASSE